MLPMWQPIKVCEPAEIITFFGEPKLHFYWNFYENLIFGLFKVELGISNGGIYKWCITVWLEGDLFGVKKLNSPPCSSMTSWWHHNDVMVMAKFGLEMD